MYLLLFFNKLFEKKLIRYGMAVVAVAAAVGLRLALQSWIGPDIPTFLTYYPAVILVAVAGGLGPGLLTTGISVLVIDYFFLPPYGQLVLVERSDFVTLSFFMLMGVLISAIAERYRANLKKLAVYRAEQAAWESRAKLESALASSTDALYIFDTERIVHANHGLVSFLRLNSLEDIPQTLESFQKMIELRLPDGTVLAPEMWPVQRALRGESETAIQYSLKRKDTGEVWIGNCSFNPVHDNRGEIAYGVVVARDITEQKAAEEILRKREHEFSLIYENMHDVLFYLAVEPGEQFRFVTVNPSFLRVTGWDIHQVVGKPVQKVIPESSLGTVLEKYREAIQGKKTVFWNETAVYPRGEKHAEVFVSPVCNEQGECTNLIGVLHDVTESYEFRRHIEQLNRIYSVLSDTNQTIVRVKDTAAMLDKVCQIAVEKGQFRMAWVGQADEARRVVTPYTWSGVAGGYLDSFRIDTGSVEHQDGPVGQCLLSGVHAICNDIENDPGFFTKQEACARGYRACGAFPLHLDEKVWGVLVLYASELEFFDDDEVNLLDEMAMDISFALEVNRHEESRRHSEEELRRRTAFFEAQVDSSLDGVMVVDDAGRLILHNQRLMNLLHLPAEVAENPDEKVLRRYVGSLVKNPEQFHAKAYDLMTYPEMTGRDEIELLDGTVIERCASPVRDKDGKHYGKIGTFRDITERRKLEENLRQAQKMEALGQLSGGIAHDFNNLLTVILGCAEFLGEEVKSSERQSRMVKMIVDAARRGADVTHQMLAFARRQSLQLKSVDVTELLLGMKSFLLHALPSGIDLRIYSHCEHCYAVVDPSQLENALLNLCVNARDAMPHGGKLIVEASRRTLDKNDASLHAEVEPGEFVQINVTDTGIGILPEILDKVFDPFFTTKEAGKGTGLGLSMVYGFAKQSHGYVQIDSEPGHGTTVRLYLPRATESGDDAGKSNSQTEELHGSETILLVEDDNAVREYTLTQLRSLGYTVLTASNGEQALKQLQAHTEIDMLFTDIVMPGGIDGCELGRRARGLRPSLSVLYCSGYPESVFAHRDFLPGSVEILPKPYTRLEVAQQIRKVFNKKQ
jgi:PAS domain S-box-containing protein